MANKTPYNLCLTTAIINFILCIRTVGLFGGIMMFIGMSIDHETCSKCGMCAKHKFMYFTIMETNCSVW